MLSFIQYYTFFSHYCNAQNNISQPVAGDMYLIQINCTTFTKLHFEQFLSTHRWQRSVMFSSFLISFFISWHVVRTKEKLSEYNNKKQAQKLLFHEQIPRDLTYYLVYIYIYYSQGFLFTCSVEKCHRVEGMANDELLLGLLIFSFRAFYLRNLTDCIESAAGILLSSYSMQSKSMKLIGVVINAYLDPV